MPAALTSIGSNAFEGCTKLTVIELPERVYDIGSRAFYRCSNLSQLTIRSNRLTTVGSNAFDACTKLYEIFNLSELVNTLLAMTKAQLESHRHKLKVNIADVIHENVIGDSHRIQQVFVNLKD